MVVCTLCTTPNSLDSIFCKKCGTALSEVELKEGRSKLEALVAEGVVLFNQGRMEEAFTVAQGAVEDNPSMIAAWSLKGDCHASRGEMAQAIECYEQILRLNPDSTLDRIRLNQFRNSLVLQATPPPANSRLAWAGGIAAAVLVMSSAAIIGRISADRNRLAAAELASKTVEPYLPSAPFQRETPEFSQPAPSASPAPKPGPVQPDNGAASRTEARADQSIPSLPPAPRGVLPNPAEANSETPAPAISTQVEPLRPEISGPIGGRQPARNQSVPALPAPTQAPTRDRVDEDPSAQSNSIVPAATPAPSPGEISISVRSGPKRPTNARPPSGAESETTGNPMGVQALERTARQHFQLGNFAAAASAYERALAAGGDPVGLNQRLGQANQELGRKGDALAAYNRAASAAQAAISAGRGNRERLEATLDSCRQAIRVLGGG